jgi:arylsulfatase A-like enzyme
MTPEPQPVGPGPRWPLLPFLFPNLWVAVLALTGFVAEVVLLAYRPDSIYQTQGISFLLVVLLLAWYWLSVAWLLRVLTQAILRATSAWPAWLAVALRGLTVLAGTALVMVYLASWALYFQAGRFLGYEGIEFVLINVREVWLHLVMTRPRDLWIVGLLGVLVLAGAPFLLARMARTGWSAPDAPRTRSVRRIIWCSLLLVALLLYLPSQMHGFVRPGIVLDALKYRVNPGITLVASAVEALADESIMPCLDTTELTPLSESDYRAPSPSATNRPSVVFVAIESMRHDVVHLRHQDREVMPNYNKLAREGLHLTRAYAVSTHSDYADPPIVSSLYPLWTRRHHYYQTTDAWPRTRLYDLLKPEGYATAIISSENEEWGGKSKFYASPGLDWLYDAQRSTAPTRPLYDLSEVGEFQAGVMRSGSLDDAHTTDVAIEWITQQTSAGRPFFLYVNYQYSHFPYELPPGADHPFQPCEWSSAGSFLAFPVEQTTEIRNSYYNALHEVDRQIGRLVAALRKQGRLDNTILVLTGDNGEAFNEGGRSGHAGDPFEPEIHIACAIHAPGRLKPGTEDYPTGHIDLVPTVLGLMGWPSHPNFQGIDILAGDRPPAAERLLFFHTESPLSRTDAALLGRRWKYHHDRRTGVEMLYDLKTDPEETEDLSESDPAQFGRLRAAVALWRRQQLAYYHYPFYYQNYHPPRPPRLADLP